MWCRALLITAITTCTLNQLSVQARAKSTQRLAQIKDLICVLMFSGLRKEDLDVNTLKKLQQYNVSVDNNLTNENNLQDCMFKTNLNIIQGPKPESKNLPVDHTESSINTTVQDIIKNFINQELQNITREYKPEVLSSDPSVLEDIIRRRVKTDSEPIIQIIQETRQSNLTEVSTTKRDTSQVNVEELLKAFEMFRRGTTFRAITKIKPETTTETLIRKNPKLYNTTQYQNVEKKYESHNENIEQLSRILYYLLSKDQTTSTTTTPRSTEIINLDKISRQIDKLINIYSKLDNNNKEDSKNFRKTNTGDFNTYNKQFIPTEQNFERKNEQVHINSKENIKNNTITYLNKLRGLDNPIRSAPYLPNIENHNYVKTSSISDYSSRPNIGIKDVTTNGKNYTENSVKQLVTHDLIKDISEKVKELVLKDLQKDVITTTSSATSTTAQNTFNLTQNENAQVIANAMQIFIELFQQQKSIKANSVLSTTNSPPMEPVVDEINSHHPHNLPMRVIIPQIISLPDPYGVRNMPHEIQPVLYNAYTNIATPIPDVSLLPLERNAIHRISQFNFFNDQNAQRTSAITMQTNLNEIPPLGIPVPKLLNPINQNIIVTPRNPFTPYKGHQNSYKTRNVDDFKNNYQEARANYLDFTKHLRSRQENDGYGDYKPGHSEDIKHRARDQDSVILKKIYQNENSASQNKESNMRNQYSSNGNNYFKAQLNYGMNQKDRDHFGKENIKRFHERLEKNDDDWKRGDIDYFHKGDCCKIAERQQRPIKSGEYLKYDDTHFQNFLKTQQKVNDMLEKILGTKTVSDRPKSVEVP